MKIITHIILFLLPLTFFAQENKVAVSDTGKITVVQDARIDALLSKKVEVNKKTDGKSAGYRVQIHFGGDSQVAKKIKADFINAHNDVPAYYIYEQPNFKIRVGDFKTKLDAQRFLKQIKEEFPASFVVEDKIEMMKID
jgi:hypothetical protein